MKTRCKSATYTTTQRNGKITKFFKIYLNKLLFLFLVSLQDMFSWFRLENQWNIKLGFSKQIFSIHKNIENSWIRKFYRINKFNSKWDLLERKITGIFINNKIKYRE